MPLCTTTPLSLNTMAMGVDVICSSRVAAWSAVVSPKRILCVAAQSVASVSDAATTNSAT